LEHEHLPLVLEKENNLRGREKRGGCQKAAIHPDRKYKGGGWGIKALLDI